MSRLTPMRRWLTAEVTRIRVLEHDIAIRRVHLTTLLAAIAAALIVGFTGGMFTGHYLWRPTPQQIRRSCPPGDAQLGCVTRLYAAHAHDTASRSRRPSGAHVAIRLSAYATPAGPRFPDVSSWQGHPDWNAARPHIAGAIVKADEYSQDPDFTYNATQLTRLHIPWGAYLFVRGCGYAPTFAGTVRRWITHISVLILDMEVPAAHGCAPQLAATLHTDFPHTPVAIYSGPGTWPGGPNANLPVWVAAYGPAHPPCLFTCHVGPDGERQTILAWQYTDGRYGYPTPIPGVGNGDVSINFGLLTAAPKPTVRLICFGARARPHNPTCVKVRSHAARWERASTASSRALGEVQRQIGILDRQAAVLAGRERYFHGRAAAITKAYS